MSEMTFTRPEFRVRIDRELCQKCGRCAHQCGWGVYRFTDADEYPVPDHAKCGACHRCVTFCPAGAITVEKNPLAYKESDSMSVDLRKAIWRQAETGGVLLTSMGNDRPYLRIFDHLLLDACQVTNPSIDPLREPMELRTFLGRKPDFVEVGPGDDGKLGLAVGTGSPAAPGNAHHVRRDELRLGVAERAQVAGHGGARVGHLHEHGRRRASRRPRSPTTPTSSCSARPAASASTPTTWRPARRWRSR